MAPTAKVSSIARNRTPDASDSLSSGFAKAQVFRGQGNVEPQYQVGPNNLIHSAVAEYDFAKDGSLVSGNNGLGVFIPANAVVDDVIVDVITVLSGGTVANAGISIEGDNDVAASSTIAAAPWLAGVWKGDINFGGDPGASAVKTTASREVLLNVDGTNTAGKMVIIVTYHMSTVA